MTAQAQAAGHAQVSDWWTVKTGPPNKVLPALQRLCINRKTGRRIDLDSASSLLKWLHAAPGVDADAAEVQTCCLLLLGQWVNGELYRPLKQPSGDSLVEVISQSAEAALLVAESIADHSSPRLAAATVYALGCVSSGLGTMKRRDCCSAACTVLHACGPALLQSGLISDVIGGTGHLLTSLQDDMQGSLWVLACLLSIWASHDGLGQPKENALDSIAPLYPTARRVGSSLKDPTACLPSYVELLQASAASPDRGIASAATMAAGGYLEGLHRNSRAEQSHNPDGMALERILSTACRAAASLPSGALDRSRPGQQRNEDLSVLQQDAAALACMEAFQACKKPAASRDSLLCMLRALLDSTLTLDGLFEAAASGAPAAQADAWLTGHLEGCLMRSTASLARTAAEQYRMSAPAHQQEAMECVRGFAHKLYGAYEKYARDATKAWLNAVDGGLVRQVLDKVFMSLVLLLSTFWDAAAPEEEQGTTQQYMAPGRQGIAVSLLDTLAHVQFCRMRLSAYSVLLQSLLHATASSAEAARGLLGCLPAYEVLLEEGPSGQPAWLSNTVLASRMQFLMGMLAPCIPQLPEAAVRDRVCGPALLYLKHTHSPVVSSAHLLFCAALRHVCAREELVPLYVRRSLEGYPGITPLSGLAGGYETIARHLPAGSPVLLFALQRLAQRAQAILRKPGVLLQPGLDLVSLLAHLMLLIEYNAWEDGLLLLEEVVKACEQQVALQACSCIVEILSGSDDYTRKVTLVRWYMRLADLVTRSGLG